MAMDAFSVATVTGLNLNKVNYHLAYIMSFSFGIFHFFMPLLGWLAGSTVVDMISGYDHWVAFLLLSIVGAKMIYEAVANKETLDTSKILNIPNILLLTIAVSIDSLAVGLSFYLERIQILIPALIIGAVTFVFTFLGVVLGNKTGRSFGKGTQIIGGIILIGIGLRIVITHML